MKSRNLVVKFIAHTQKFVKDVRNATTELTRMDKTMRAVSHASQQKMKQQMETPFTMFGQKGQWFQGMKELDQVKNIGYATIPKQVSAIAKIDAPIKKLGFFDKILGKIGMSSQKTNKALQGLSQMFGRVGWMAKGFFNVLQAIPTALKAIMLASIAVGYAFKKMTQHGIKAEGALETITILSGSHTKALELYAKALKYAGRTPFDPGEMGAATGRAFQYGLEDPFERSIQGMKKKVSAMDIFAALGSFTDMEGNMVGIARSMQALMTGTRKMARPFLGVIGEAWEKTKKVAQIGTKLWGQEILKNIAQIPRVLELTEKLADDVQGAWSTVKGYAIEVWLAMAGTASAAPDTMWKQLNSLLISMRNGLRVMLDDSSAFLEQLGAGFMGIFTIIFKIGAAIWAVIGIPVRKMWLSLLFLGTFVIKVVIGAFKFIWAVIKSIGEIMEKMASLFLGASSWSVIMKNNANEMNAMVMYTKDMATYIDIMIMLLTRAVFYLKDVFMDFIDMIANAFTERWNNIIFNIKTSLAEVMRDFVPDILQTEKYKQRSATQLSEAYQKKGFMDLGYSLKEVNQAMRNWAIDTNQYEVKYIPQGLGETSTPTRVPATPHISLKDRDKFKEYLKESQKQTRKESGDSIWGGTFYPTKKEYLTIQAMDNLMIQSDERTAKATKQNIEALKSGTREEKAGAAKYLFQKEVEKNPTIYTGKPFWQWDY